MTRAKGAMAQSVLERVSAAEQAEPCRVADRVSENAVWSSGFITGMSLASLRNVILQLWFEGYIYNITIDEFGHASVHKKDATFNGSSEKAQIAIVGRTATDNLR
jgi:hypothetical protein